MCEVGNMYGTAHEYVLCTYVWIYMHVCTCICIHKALSQSS